MTETTPVSTSHPDPDPLPTTMRAATQDRYGGGRRTCWRVTQVPVPPARSGRGAGSRRRRVGQRPHLHLTAGLPMFARVTLGIRRPRSGRYRGGRRGRHRRCHRRSGVTRFRIGDEVFGARRPGRLRGVPRRARGSGWSASQLGLSLEETSTLGVAAETALQGLRDWAGLREGQTVLINGASRRGRHLRRPAREGARCLPRHRSLQHGQRPDGRSPRRRQGRRLHAGGRQPQATQTLRRGVRQRGILVAARLPTPARRRRDLCDGHRAQVEVAAPAAAHARRAALLQGHPRPFGSRPKVAGRDTADLELLRDLVERGDVRPVMDRRFTLDEAGEALRLQGEFHARGKSVVIP